MLQSEADYLSGRVAATGVDQCLLDGASGSWRANCVSPREDCQVVWAWEYSQEEGTLSLSTRWSLTDVTTGEERVLSTNALDSPAGQMMLNLLSGHQYSSDWYLAAGSRGFDELVALPGDPRLVDAFAGLQMSLVVVLAPRAVLLAITAIGLIGFLRRRS